MEVKNTNKGKKAHQCQLCDKCFMKPSELKYHINRKHPNSNISVELARPSLKDYNYLCEYCAKLFINLRNFNAHRSTHTHIVLKVLEINCPICDFKGSAKQVLLDHFNKEHDIVVELEKLKFPNIQEFYEWKVKIEMENHYKFVKMRGTKVGKEFSKTTYACHRSGNFISSGTHLRHLKTLGSCKINGLCPASLKVYEYGDNTCTVEYAKTHVGHDMDLGHIYLTARERKNIAAKISAKIPFKDILNEVRDSVTNCEIGRMHLLNRKDLHNIELCFNLKSSSIRHKNDAISIDAWVNEMQNRECVLFYKAQSVSSQEYSCLKDEDFVLAIMTEGQKEMLLKYGQDCICVDGTHGSNPYNFELHTLLVLDDLREGFPCAFLVSNRSDEEVITIFFSLISRQIGIKLEPKVFMSDLAPVYYNAWQRTMYPADFRLFCTWHVDKAWRKNLNKISTPEKRASAYKALRTLLQETDKTIFERMLPKFIDELLADPETTNFGKYFMDYYGHRVECWAYCYRVNSGINTNMHIERMHRTLKYLYMGGKHVKRLDLGIHATMQFVRDKLFDRLITINKGKLSRKLKDLRNRHANSVNLTFDKIFPHETGWQVASSSASQTYFVYQGKTDCQCKLICSDCQNVCLHQYVCTCIDASIKWNMCKHIHLVCRYLQSKPVEDVTKNAQEPENENHMINILKPTDEEEGKIIKAVSNTRREDLNDDDVIPTAELEKFIFNLNEVIRSNVRTVGEFRAVKNLVAPIEPTLKAVQESKTKKVCLFSQDKPKSGAIGKITPQRNNLKLFSTKNKKSRYNNIRNDTSE